MKRGLRYKLIGIVFLAVVPFVLYAGFDYFHLLNESKTSFIAENQEKAMEMAHEIEDFVDSTQNVLYSIALHPSLISKDSSTCNRIFAQLLPLFPNHLNLIAADMDGRNFASAVNPAMARRLSYRDFDWFKRGSKGTAVISDLFQSRLLLLPTVMITMPVFDSSGTQTAVLGFPVNVYRLQEHFISTESLHKHAIVTVLDNTATTIISTEDNKLIGKPYAQLPLLNEFNEKPSGSLVYAGNDGMKRFYSYATVQATGWKVVISVPYDDVLAEASQGARTHLLLLIGICLAASLSAFFYSRSLANRLEVLINALNEVAGGNFDCRIDVGGNDEISTACNAFNHMTEERQKTEGEILSLAATLEKRVDERTSELTIAKNELESFSYAVSHDLQAPVRHLLAYSQILLDDHGDEFSASSREFLLRINRSGVQMRELITQLLALSRLNSQELNRFTVDLGDICRTICSQLAENCPERSVEVVIADGLTAAADPALLTIALHNLLDNAWKYTSKVAEPRVVIGETTQGGGRCFFIRDNGIGFDMAYRERLFTPFQRLHSEKEFEGTGVGLATVMRIMQKHGGTIWADSSPGNGAVFYFTLDRET
jgi:signal transduction histidine kinase